MFQRLPSPSALRTFEAAARHLSFKAAADELGVTPTAVSHQIRALEEALALPLFLRRTRAVELTAAGARLAPALHGAFSDIRDALEEIAAAETVLTVTTTPAFAALRLVARLPEFYARHPGLTVQLDTGIGQVDLRRDRRIDVAIRYAAGSTDGLHTMPLLDEWFGAFASPTRFTADTDPATASLLETDWGQSVLSDVTWRGWFEAGGRDPALADTPVRFEHEDFVLQAAIAGQGIALASSALVGDLTARGLLHQVQPDRRLPGAGYTVLCTPERAALTKVRRFLAWLRETFVTDGAT